MRGYSIGPMLFLLLFQVSLYGGSGIFFNLYNRGRAAAGIDERIRCFEMARAAWKQEFGVKWLGAVNNLLAFAYYKKGRMFLKKTVNGPEANLRQAEDIFIKAADLGIKKDYPFHWLFYVYRKQKAYGRALSVFGIYHKKYPQRYALSMILGDCHSHLGNFEKGIYYYGEAQKKTKIPKYRKDIRVRMARNYGRWAVLEQKRGNLKKIGVLLQQAERLDPGSGDYNLASAGLYYHMIRTLEHFGNGQYKNALVSYGKARQFRKRNTRLFRQTKLRQGWLYLENIIIRRSRLGRINPGYVHRIKVLYYPETRINTVDRLITGRRIRVNSRITPAMKRITVIHEKSLKRIMETFSGGRFSLSFDRTDTGAAVDRLYYWYFKDKPYISPDIGAASAKLSAAFWHETTKQFDTVLSYWCGKRISLTSTGGGFTSPYDRKSLRGGMILPADYMAGTWKSSLILHEFFHVIEVMAGIRPVHGASSKVRKFFPGWKGQGEIDYIRWHFEKTILPRSVADLNFRKRYPVRRLKNKLLYKVNPVHARWQGRSKSEQRLLSGQADRMFADSRMLKQFPSLQIKTPFSFIFLADTHIAYGKHRYFSRFCKNIKPGDRLILDGGDLTWQGEAVDFRYYMQAMRKTSLPYYPVPGNHDIWLMRRWKNYRKEIGPGSYTFTAGPVRFVCLDSSRGTLGEKQKQWLETVLRKRRRRFCIVVTHIPIFSADRFGKPNYVFSEKETLRRIFERYRVDCVLTGHSHRYYTLKLNGVRYVTTENIYDSRQSFIRFFVTKSGIRSRRVRMK